MDPFKLKIDAAISLRRADYPPRRLVLMHSAITIGIGLLVTLIVQLLQKMIDSTGGLSSLGDQAVLSTVQSVLQIAQAVLLPFWSAGLVYMGLRIREERLYGPSDLLEGFRRWKDLLFAGLRMLLQYFLRAMIAIWSSAQLLLFTPFSPKILQALQAMSADPDLSVVDALGDSYVPVTITSACIFAVLFFILAIPVFYRFRLVNYLILDREPLTSGQAVFASRLLMQQRRKALFKLDLSFWWYYLLELVSIVIMLGDIILNLLGISLPMDPMLSFWVFLLAGSALQLAVQVWARPKVHTTYAHFYSHARKAGPLPPKPSKASTRPAPKNVPWNY